MSFYATIQAELSYEKQEDFDKALDILRQGPWINDKGVFIDECDTPLTEESTINSETREIDIPCFHYRNLSWFLDDLVVGAKGWALWSSTDGCFEGGEYEEKDGKLVETTVDLEEWAKEHVEEPMPNNAEEPDEYCEWMSDVEQQWMEF